VARKQEVYWFKHEGNARREQKTLTMRTIYGAEGYGWYWMLLEMMRESENYRLKLVGKYAMKGIAKELDADTDKMQEFIGDCIEEFELFESDGETFWSPILLGKMKAYDEIVEKRREAANTRWKDR